MEPTELERLMELEAALVAEDADWVMRLTGLDRISAKFMIGIGNGTIEGDAVLAPPKPETQPLSARR